MVVGEVERDDEIVVESLDSTSLEILSELTDEVSKSSDSANRFLATESESLLISGEYLERLVSRLFGLGGWRRRSRTSRRSLRNSLRRFSVALSM